MFWTWNNRRQLLEYPGKIFFRHCFQMILEFKRKFLKYFEFFVHLFDLTTTSHHLWMYTHILPNICAFSNVPNIATSLTETVHLCTSFDTSFTLMATNVYWDGYSGSLEIDSEKQEWCEASCATKKVFKNLKIYKDWLWKMFLLKLTFI